MPADCKQVILARERSPASGVEAWEGDVSAISM
jgi:hypothetical protein